MIRKDAWPFYKTTSDVRLCWEIEEVRGPKGRNAHRLASSLDFVRLRRLCFPDSFITTAPMSFGVPLLESESEFPSYPRYPHVGRLEAASGCESRVAPDAVPEEQGLLEFKETHRP